MGLTGRIGLVLMVLSLLGWIVYMLVVFVPAFKVADFVDYNPSLRALYVTLVCGISALLGWFLFKQNWKFD